MREFFLEKQNAKDHLTEIYTRDVIIEFINYLINKNCPFSVILLDIDNFKYVNDNYGHSIGDIVIKEAAKRIENSLGDTGVAGRFGGDEFIVVLPEITDYDEVWTACRNIASHIGKKEIKDANNLYITVTMGISRFPENEQTYEKLLETADKALYRGKTKSRNCFIIYLPEKHANIILKTEKDKQRNSMQLHSDVFNTLTKTDDLAEEIKNLFDLFNSYFMFDNICIQNESAILYQKIHELSKSKNFKYIDSKMIEDCIPQDTDYFYVNKKEHLLESKHNNLYDALKEQQISSTFCCKIACKNKIYGLLRIDSSHIKIWQYSDMDILITAARLIGVLLSERKISLDDLKF